MTYAVRTDLEVRYGADEVNDLADGDDGKVTSALLDASAEVDAALAGIYTLPLPGGTYPYLNSIVCRIARRRLYDEDPPENISNAARSAKADLGAIMKGSRSLAASDGTVVPRIGGTAKLSGPKQVMTSENLAGFR